MTDNEILLEEPTIKQDIYDVAIIGGGVAGLSAALYSARDGNKTIVLEGEYMSDTDMPGGALNLTESIENYPGFLMGAGAELVANIREQALTFNAELIEARALHISNYHSPIKVLETTAGTLRAKTIILAMGAVSKMLHIENEMDLLGRGVSTCATCDGFFFKDKKVVVVGGGDTAIEEALHLTTYASKVTLLVRKDKLRAVSPDVDRLFSKDNFEVQWNVSPSSLEVSDEGTLSSVRLQNNLTNQYGDYETDGLFIAIGRVPSTKFLENDDILLDDEGYLVRDESLHVLDKNHNPISGVYTAGDVSDKVYRQAITSAGDAVKAVLQIRQYLRENKSI